MAGEALIEIRDLKKYFPIRKGLMRKTVGHVKAVDGASLHIYAGETLGLVGESGCGKSTLGRCILRLMEPTAGEVFYKGQDLLRLNKEEMRSMRKKLQIIFQDPYASLNAKMTVEEIISEPMVVHKTGAKEEIRKSCRRLMEAAGLPEAAADRYPHEFSGGQRQRIGIARALALNPEFVVCDEPVSALDVSVRSQILNLMSDLKEELGLTFLFISHDLSVVKHISDRVAVMYLGQLVELAEKDELYRNPRHPYTKALLSAIPVPDPALKRQRVILEGDVPSPVNPPSTCHFLPRCPDACDACRGEAPPLKDLGGGHYTACWRNV